MYMTINFNLKIHSRQPVPAKEYTSHHEPISTFYRDILLLPGSFILSSTHQSLMRLCMNFLSRPVPFWMDNVWLNNNQIFPSIPQFRCLANSAPLGTAVFHLALTQHPLPVFYLDFAFSYPLVCLLAAAKYPKTNNISFTFSVLQWQLKVSAVNVPGLEQIKLSACR